MKFFTEFREHLLVVLFAFIGMLQGYIFCGSDLATYIPFVLHHYDPRLFSNDLLMEIIPAYPASIWKILGLLTYWAPCELLFKTMFTAQVILITTGMKYFYTHFFGKGRQWIVFMMMMVVAKAAPGYGQYGINPYSYFHAAAVAMGATLFILVFLDKGWWLRSALLCGLLYNIHPFSAAFLSLTLALRYCFLSPRPSIIRLFSSFVLCVLAASPSLMVYFSRFLYPGHVPFDLDLWIGIAKKRVPQLFFSRWVPDYYAHFAIAVLLLVTRFRKHPLFFRFFPVTAAVFLSVLMMLIGELFSIKFLIELQISRCIYWVFIICCAFIANRITEVSVARLQAKDLFWLITGSFFMLYSSVSSNPNIFWLLPAISILFVPLVLYRFSPIRWWKPWLISMAVSLCIATSVRMITVPKVPIFSHLKECFNCEFEDMQRWCAINIPLDEVIMTPIYLEGFRCHSFHAIYGDFKDGGPHIFCNSTIFRWWERMQNFGITLQTRNSDFPKIYHNNACRVASDAKIRYVVYDKRHGLMNGIPLYENSVFGIIDLTSQGKAVLHAR